MIWTKVQYNSKSTICKLNYLQKMIDVIFNNGLNICMNIHMIERTNESLKEDVGKIFRWFFFLEIYLILLTCVIN